MDHHRRCEACTHCHTVTPPPTRPYLKRRSKFSNATNRTVKAPKPVNATTTHTETSMADARTINASDPDPLPASLVDCTSDLTSDDADFDQRVEAARVRVSRLLEEARKPLTAPCVAPTELTAEERADKADALAWAWEYETREHKIEEAEGKNDHLTEEVVDAANGVATEQAAIAAVPQNPIGEAQLIPESSPEKPLDAVDGSQSEDSVPSAAPTQPAPVCETIIATLPPQNGSRAIPGPRSTKPYTKNNTASGNAGWHTLWSFAYNASW